MCRNVFLLCSNVRLLHDVGRTQHHLQRRVNGTHPFIYLLNFIFNVCKLPKPVNIFWLTEICNTQPWVFFKPIGLQLTTCILTRNRTKSPAHGKQTLFFHKRGFPGAALGLKAPELEEESGEASVLYCGEIHFQPGLIRKG